MSQKQIFFSIFIGSLVLACANTYVYTQNLGILETAIGFFLFNVVTLLFLSHFAPSLFQKKAAVVEPFTNNKTYSSPTNQSKTNLTNKKTRQIAPKKSISDNALTNTKKHQLSPQKTSPTVNTTAASIENNQVNHMQGIIKWYNKRKGFGFLLHHNHEIFFHRNALQSPPHLFTENVAVTFEIGNSAKGDQALNIQLVSTQ